MPGPSRPAERLRAAMLVGGFPTPEEPNRCVFNLRAAERLAGLVELEVIFHRAWRPGRPLVARSVADAGFAVTTVTSPQAPGATRINLALAKAVLPRLLGASLAGIDVIHSVNAAGPGIAGSALARRVRVPHVAQVIGSDVNSVLPVLGARWPVAGWERALAAVACNSEALRRAFLALYPGAPHVRTVYRGVDLARFSPVGPTGGPQASRTPVRFLYLGGLPAYPELPHGDNTKGGRTLMAAWQAAEAAGGLGEASLLFAGPATPSPALAAWRAGLRRPEQVLLPGLIGPAEIAAALRAADVVLVPSLEEGLPNVAMEAAGCARAVVGSAVGGVAEVIEDGVSGMVLPAADVAAWCGALLRLAADEALARRLGQAARRRMEARFDARRFAPAMEALYRSAMDERDGRRLSCVG